MTATSATPSIRPDRSGLWTFLRLLGGWATVAVLAYLLSVPSESFGWAKMVFAWVLLTLIADEFAGWFGYIGLALGVLPFLHTAPEQWFTVFPLVFAALFALLLLKHSGGPFVVPFAALIFIITLVGAEKLGIKMKIPLGLISTNEFRRASVLPMAAVMGFSFLRQLSSMLWQWQTTRKTRAAALPAHGSPLTSSSSTQVPLDSAKSSATVPSSAASQSPVILDLDLNEVPAAPEKPNVP